MAGESAPRGSNGTVDAGGSPVRHTGAREMPNEKGSEVTGAPRATEGRIHTGPGANGSTEGPSSEGSGAAGSTPGASAPGPGNAHGSDDLHGLTEAHPPLRSVDLKTLQMLWRPCLTILSTSAAGIMIFVTFHA